MTVNKKSMIINNMDHQQVVDNGEYGNDVQTHNLTTIGCVGGDVGDLQKNNLMKTMTGVMVRKINK